MPKQPADRSGRSWSITGSPLPTDPQRAEKKACLGLRALRWAAVRACACANERERERNNIISYYERQREKSWIVVRADVRPLFICTRSDLCLFHRTEPDPIPSLMRNYAPPPIIQRRADRGAKSSVYKI